MGWRKHWYGENASFLHKCVTNGLVFGSSLGFYAVWIDFVPSELWWRWGSVATALLSLLVSGVLYRGFKTGQLRSAPGFGGWKRLTAAVLVPLVVFGILWLLIVRVVPDMLARAIGQPAEVTSSSMRAIYSNSRRLCDYRLEGELLSRALPADYMCISETGYSAVRQAASVTLRGRETPLGLHIDQVLVPTSTNN